MDSILSFRNLVDLFQRQKGELCHEDKGSKVSVQGGVDGDGKSDFDIFEGVVRIGAEIRI